MSKLTIPEVVERFAAYQRKHPAWGCLHIVLDDGNIGNDSVEFCIGYAEGKGDTEAVELGQILLRMSKTQRLKLPSAVYRFERERQA
ncbi:MAG: hypothetical protein R3193_09155 [Marinobacter sp.]|nr:hypothetical protein [Marinobacter sp.]